MDNRPVICQNGAILPAIATHRYRFWYLFPTGDMIENHFTVPGTMDAAAADQLAAMYWLASLEKGIKTALPTPDDVRKLQGVSKVLTMPVAREIANGSSFEVIRPGELV